MLSLRTVQSNLHFKEPLEISSRASQQQLGLPSDELKAVKLFVRRQVVQKYFTS